MNSDVKTLVKYISGHSAFFNAPALPKMNEKADRMRTLGNGHYLEEHYQKALYCYNHSIAFAETGTDRLGMGYANRSAICFQLGEYEMALFNIDLAKKNNYPEKLMPKLLQRERNCKQKIADGHAIKAVPCPRVSLNVEVNPKIPFLAKGIKMKYDPKFGRGLVAEKDFNPGDVISDEKLELCGIDYNLSFQACSQCSARLVCILIPCPKCPFFMYCSEECLEMNWKLYHRFECAVASNLCSVSRSVDMLTPRLFFYGLSSFGDNLKAMMEYCERPIVTESNPLELDYTNENRLEVFKALHNTKPRCNLEQVKYANNTAAAYYVAFLSNPVVKAIIRTERQRQFFLRSLVFYGKVEQYLSTESGFGGEMVACIRSTGSLINHSCDPQAVTLSQAGRIKLVMLRPVRKGEQIFTSYGPTWYSTIIHGPLPFKCLCIVCDCHEKASREWHRLTERDYLPQSARKDLEVLYPVKDTKLIAMQQFIKRYAHYHPQSTDLRKLLNEYFYLLHITAIDENLALLRAKLWAPFVEQ